MSTTTHTPPTKRNTVLQALIKGLSVDQKEAVAASLGVTRSSLNRMGREPGSITLRQADVLYIELGAIYGEEALDGAFSLKK